MHGQALVPAAHTQPAGARRQEAAVLDPQDRPLPPAALAPQMPQGMLGTAGPSATCQPRWPMPGR